MQFGEFLRFHRVDNYKEVDQKYWKIRVTYFMDEPLGDNLMSKHHLYKYMNKITQVNWMMAPKLLPLT